MADLGTIRAVELIKTGMWDISTGRWHVTADALAAARDAHTSGAVPKPIVKLGHVDARFDGEPALGWVDNLTLTDDGQTLVGDLVGVPPWLAEVAASAYPRRSVEAVENLQVPDGTTHRLVLTAVALLGVTAPGVTTLQSLHDIQQLYGIAASAGRRITVTLPTGAIPVPLTARQRVEVRAARSRRRHRNAARITAKLATIDPNNLH